MSHFIDRTVRDILERYEDLGSLALVLPNRRSTTVLKGVFQKHLSGSSTWLPKIYTMWELMQQISGLSLIGKPSLWMDFYIVMCRQPGACFETFDEFIQWGPQVLSDFDELDLHLIDTQRFFDYISSAERISHWESRDFVREIPFVEKHFLFWEKLARCYVELRDRLLRKRQAYHGLIFRNALDCLDDFLLENPDLGRVLFIGMNALSRSEAILIQRLIRKGKAEIYWDVDTYYYDDEAHESGRIIRSYFERWPDLKGQPLRWISEDFKKSKQIEVIGTPGQVGQAKLAGSLLAHLVKCGEDLSRAVVVLADEGLLIPLLHAIPKEIEQLDVVASYPLQALPLGQSFLMIFRLFSNRQKLGRDGFYHKDLLQLLADVHFKKLLHEGVDRQLSMLIVQKNISFFSDDLVREHVQEETLLRILDVCNKDPKACLSMLGTLSQKFRALFSEGKEPDREAALEFLDHFDRWVQGLDLLLYEQPESIVEVKALASLYERWLRLQKARSFEKNPGGLLLMGLLETCLLDFDTVIMISVNEGILPPEKAQGSWIPFDIRKRFDLPTYQEQDALYAYHFYHLLQRSQKVYLIYNTEPDAYGSGERSRFIHQLEIESLHDIIHKVASPESGRNQCLPIVVEKSVSVMRRLGQIALKGFSPSAISLYIRDPLEFYQQRVLNLTDCEVVEGHFEAHHMGSIVHQTLEALYRPVQGRLLTLEALERMRVLCGSTVEYFFREAGVDFLRGKNLLGYHVVKKYVEGLIAWDEKAVQQGHRIIIQALECALSELLEVSLHQVRLCGLIDRVDVCDGLLRIIDYKTGGIKGEELKITTAHLEELVQNPARAKALQLLIYAQLWLSSNQGLGVVYPGILSLRKMRQGWLSLSVDKDQAISTEVLKKFLPLLLAKLAELFDPTVPFVGRLEKN